jgi:hypothetical protein
MPGLSEEANLTIAVLLILGVGYLIYQIDRRVKKEGALVKRDGSSKSRMYALIVGLLIGGFVSLEWIVGIRIYLLLILAIALIGYGFGFDHLLEIFQPKQTQFRVNEIPGLEWMTKEEIKMQVQAGAKFVVFEYCISFFSRAGKRSSRICFIKPKESYIDKSIGYSAISLIFGWLSPVKLYKILRTNLSGGREVTQEVLELYDNPHAVLQLG